MRFAPQLAAMEAEIAAGNSGLVVESQNNAQKLTASQGTIGRFFSIGYGQRELHSKEALSDGPSLIVSSSGMDNGCYGFFDFNKLIKPPFVSVPSTGSIGEAAVQTRPCGVVDDCLILTPKPGTPLKRSHIKRRKLSTKYWQKLPAIQIIRLYCKVHNRQ